MAETVVYEYTATLSNGVYTVSNVPDTPVAVLVATLSPGDTFVVDGKVFDYVGAADATPGGAAVGFFAENAKTGKISFFSTSPITGKEKLYLNSSQDYTICFMAGTRIATPNGSVAVEELAVGQLVLTADGQQAPVIWVGRQTVSRVFANPNRVLPIRIKAGALDDQLPARDLLVSPDHALLVDNVLVHAGALVNGRSIVREGEVPESFVYYHVELENHALILAEGVPAETFIDNVDRMAFDNWDEHVRLYPEGRSIPEMAYPRAASARQVPAAVAHRLEARADGMSTLVRDAA